jgi:two-component system, chemotaxis family, CheB/CheR fusion protein
VVEERGTRTVLLIDDEQAGLQLRKLVLESNGFSVFAATARGEALTLFKNHDVDVVVTDHLLGRATALELAATMKRLKPHIPIVSLSGTTNVDEALRYADHFIGKAEGPERLINTLERLFSEKASRTPAEVAKTPVILNLPTHELLSAVVEDTSDAVLTKTLDGIVTSWNHAAELMYGYSRDEMVGKSVSTLLPPDRPDEVTHILSRLKQGERISHFETVRVAKDGRRLDVAITISPIRNSDGQLLGASTIARDISHHKRAEEALRKAEKLALTGRMAATVAHEINNPLEAIGNILYLLKSSGLSPESRKYVELAQEELKRVSEITRLTLGMQRGTDRRESVQLTKLLDNVLTIYQRKTLTLGVEITKSYKDQGVVVGSPGELRQVFSNLIVNAMDALATSGDRLVLRVRRSRRWDTGQVGVRVSVLDNGPGIPPEHRKNLFQAFYTTKGDQGTGIGLWTSVSIVHKHGGTMRVRSSVRAGRNGTSFSVFLPLGS